MQQQKTPQPLRISYPAHWGKLIPSLQHTAITDALLGNQFEALVKVGKNGIVEPLAARQWSVNDARTEFVFTIDRQRRFSDGTFLRAQHFKDAWESSLTTVPDAANNSLADVIYRLRGYRPEATAIAGIVVVDDDTLVLQFVKPFRMALDHLSGSRFASFIRRDGHYLGTGPYTITEEKDDRLSLFVNPYASVKANVAHIEVAIHPPAEALNRLRLGQLDVVEFATGMDGTFCQQPGVGCWVGQASSHHILAVNGLENRLFEDKQHRQALQFLVHDILNSNPLPNHVAHLLDVDSQVYLPLQPGRLTSEQAKACVDAGSAYVDALIVATKKRPLYMVTSDRSHWIQSALQKRGLHFVASAAFVSNRVRARMYYKTHEADLIVATLGVASGDPDGLYHAIGRQGAILSPMTYRARVGQLAESGRDLPGSADLHRAYQRVSDAILTEVPFVHLGFNTAMALYRDQIVAVPTAIKKRFDDGFHLYERRR